MMRRIAFEIETIARPEAMLLAALEANVKLAAKDVQELFALMGVCLAAAGAGRDGEKMRFHDGVAPGEQFHADSIPCIEDLAIGGADAVWIGFGRLEEREDIGAEEAGQAA
jgi:hypothetical protein